MLSFKGAIWHGIFLCGHRWLNCKILNYNNLGLDYIFTSAKAIMLWSWSIFYSCRCPYEAVQKSHLVRHMETHNILKRYSCNQCHFSANTIGYMRIHYTRSHPGKCSPFLGILIPVTWKSFSVEPNHVRYKEDGTSFVLLVILLLPVLSWTGLV